MIYGHSSSTLMFLFELRGNVVISEFSNQGAIRIGHANNQVSPKFQKIFWDDLRDDLRVSISHLGHWKQKTDDAISRMTMERVPR